MLDRARETSMAGTRERHAGNNGTMKLVAGNSNRALAAAIGDYLGIPLTKAVVRRFADMEVFVEIQENVRGADVFAIQSTSFPANDHLMELLIITDALRRASARRITAVIPYYGYARQDRKVGPRTPISAKLVANLITNAGADRVLTLDLHAGQIQGFFDIPTDNLFAAPVMMRDIRERFDLSKVIVVSPDVGGVVRARGLAKRIDAPLAIIDKRRERPGESEVANVIGRVDGGICILVDDIVDSGGTLINAAEALLEKGAHSVYAYITHGVLSGKAVDRVSSSHLKELVITDSIQPSKAVAEAKNIRVLSIGNLIGEAISRTAAEESVSSLFD
jgi:ribose-phosphate pyrophosphokinase